MVLLDLRHLPDHLAQIIDSLLLVIRERAGRIEMIEQHHQRVLDPSDLLAIARHIGQHLLLDRGLTRLPELDVDQPHLASDRIEQHGPGIDRLRDIAGQRETKRGHGGLLVEPVVCRSYRADLTAYQLTTAVYSSTVLPPPGTRTCQAAEPALSLTCSWDSDVIFQSPRSGSRTVTATGLESALRSSIR